MTEAEKHEKRVQKALKLYALVKRPTGNPHADSVAFNTFNDYMNRHKIDLAILDSYADIEFHLKFDDEFLAELFLLISMKQAEKVGNKMLQRTRVVVNRETCTAVCTGPKSFWDELQPLAAKLERKYTITRAEVKAKLEPDKPQMIQGFGGSIIIIGNGISYKPKYSEVAFFNAFLIKYDLIPKVIIDDMKRKAEEELAKNGVVKNPVNQNDIDQMYHMFHKESLNEQIDVATRPKNS